MKVEGRTWKVTLKGKAEGLNRGAESRHSGESNGGLGPQHARTQAPAGGAVAVGRKGPIIATMDKTLPRRSRQSSHRAARDRLLRFMQTPKARKGMRAAFNASSSELGQIAVVAARKGS